MAGKTADEVLGFEAVYSLADYDSQNAKDFDVLKKERDKQVIKTIRDIASGSLILPSSYEQEIRKKCEYHETHPDRSSAAGEMGEFANMLILSKLNEGKNIGQAMTEFMEENPFRKSLVSTREHKMEFYAGLATDMLAAPDRHIYPGLPANGMPVGTTELGYAHDCIIPLKDGIMLNVDISAEVGKEAYVLYKKKYDDTMQRKDVESADFPNSKAYYKLDEAFFELHSRPSYMFEGNILNKETRDAWIERHEQVLSVPYGNMMDNGKIRDVQEVKQKREVELVAQKNTQNVLTKGKTQ